METPADLSLQTDALGESAEGADWASEDLQWLDPAEAEQMRAAVERPKVEQRRRTRELRVAFAGALFLHALCIAALAAALIRVAPIRWQLNRGDSAVSTGSSAPGSVQEDDQAALAASELLRPLPGGSVQGGGGSSRVIEEDITALTQRLAAPIPDPPDPVIGISTDQSTPALPHFATTRPRLGQPAERVAAGVAPSTRGHSVGGVTAPPRVATQGGGRRGARDGLDSRGLPIPAYPAESRRRGEEGVVMIDVEVLADGRVGQIRIAADGGHPRLASAAVEALRGATFEPAQADGRATVGHILIPYRFTLQ